MAHLYKDIPRDSREKRLLSCSLDPDVGTASAGVAAFGRASTSRWELSKPAICSGRVRGSLPQPSSGRVRGSHTHQTDRLTD
jgi:hypothetical protein